MMMKTKRNVFVISLIISLTFVVLGFFGLADLIQWVVDFPDAFTYWVFNNRWFLMIVGTLAIGGAIYLNLEGKFMKKKYMISFVALYGLLFMSSFVAPSYMMFRSQHQTAEFIDIAAVQNSYLEGRDEVIVLNINGDARAYPNKWIVQPHIAGDVIGGENVVMTYCGLSHVAMAFDSSIEGKPIDLKVMSQLKNNLVIFDNETKDPIPQVYGSMVNSKRKLNALSSTVMPYASFKKLYPKGKVFLYENTNIFDDMVYLMLQKTIYSDGGQYDKSTEELSFPSIKHIDKRLHAKEQIYGVDVAGNSIAFTKEYLVQHGGVVKENIGGTIVTVKYFAEYDFVDMYYGDVPQVNAHGFNNGVSVGKVAHYNKMLWRVWSNFYRETEVRS